MNDQLYNGIMRPFRRDGKKDFRHAGGPEAISASIGQILGTAAKNAYAPGELPWRDDFGSLLHLLKHKRSISSTRELARFYAVNALAKWEPRIDLVGVRVGIVDVRDSARNRIGKAVEIAVAYKIKDVRENAGRQDEVYTSTVRIPLGAAI